MWKEDKSLKEKVTKLAEKYVLSAGERSIDGRSCRLFLGEPELPKKALKNKKIVNSQSKFRREQRTEIRLRKGVKAVRK